MPELKCTVNNCYYNKRENCCKGTIEVGGKEAKSTDDTCCDSFVVRERDSYTNAEEQPCKMIQVECQATKCTYNDDCACQAEDIGISGRNANDCGATECASFRCECS